MEGGPKSPERLDGPAVMIVVSIDRRDEGAGIEYVNHARFLAQVRRYALFVLRSAGPRIVPKCFDITEGPPRRDRWAATASRTIADRKSTV